MRILITGTKGYIATSFSRFAEKKSKGAFSTQLIDLRGDTWRDISFAPYDVLLHSAGIVHQRETPFNQYDYYIINRDLSCEVAKKAKADGVKQLIFLSSLNVYGLTSGNITANTPAAPVSNYGRSKLAAESLLSALGDDAFRVAVLRPPMVYGQNCPGNFKKLCRLVSKAPFFPNYENARSMVYIENLCLHIKSIIEGRQSGLFFPRDPAPISISEMAAAIAKAQNKHNLRLTRVFNGAISFMSARTSIVSKLFGNLIIDPSLPDGGGKDLVGFPESVWLSVGHGRL